VVLPVIRRTFSHNSLEPLGLVVSVALLHVFIVSPMRLASDLIASIFELRVSLDLIEPEFPETIVACVNLVCTESQTSELT